MASFDYVAGGLNYLESPYIIIYGIANEIIAQDIINLFEEYDIRCLSGGDSPMYSYQSGYNNDVILIYDLYNDEFVYAFFDGYYDEESDETFRDKDSKALKIAEVGVKDLLYQNQDKRSIFNLFF